MYVVLFLNIGRYMISLDMIITIYHKTLFMSRSPGGVPLRVTRGHSKPDVHVSLTTTFPRTHCPDSALDYSLQLSRWCTHVL